MQDAGLSAVNQILFLKILNRSVTEGQLRFHHASACRIGMVMVSGGSPAMLTCDECGKV